MLRGGFKCTCGQEIEVTAKLWYPEANSPQGECLVRRGDAECPDLGTVIFDDSCRAEIRIVGVGRLGFMAQFPPHHWDWVLLRDVTTLGEVRMLAKALGFESIQ